MKFSKFSNEMVAELLTHLADHEKFASLKGLRDISPSDVQELFYELSSSLKENSQNQPVVSRAAVNKKDFSATTNQVISHLSPNEEDMLLKSFKIADE